MDVFRCEKADTGMVMLLIVPGEKVLTKSPGILDGAKTIREVRPILHGLELGFRIGVTGIGS